MNSGIYKITCVVNNRIYIGSAKNFRIRFNRHLNDLKNNKHINTHLQRAFDKYGIDNFKFEILEECESSKLLETEQIYLDKLKPYNENGFNIGKSSSGGDNLSNNPNRNEIIDKIRNTLNDNISKMTLEEKKEKWSKPMENNPNWKGGLSYIEYYCKCGSIKKQKAKTCIKCRDTSYDKNPFFNKHHSDDAKRKISESRKGKYHGSQNIPIVINDVEYNSLSDASLHLDINLTTIRWRVLSKNPKYSNYSYKGQIKVSYTEDSQSERRSKPQIGKKHNHNKPFTIDGIEYRTLKEASDLLEIHEMTIKGRLLSKKFDNYKYLIR